MHAVHKTSWKWPSPIKHDKSAAVYYLQKVLLDFVTYDYNDEIKITPYQEPQILQLLSHSKAGKQIIKDIKKTD